MILYGYPKNATKGGREMEANKIRAKIKEYGLNQNSVAEKIGISANSLSRKLCGKQDFTLTEVVALCEVLKIENPQEVFLN